MISPASTQWNEQKKKKDTTKEYVYILPSMIT